MKLFFYIPTLIFAGSIFLTSNLFIDEINSVKYFFTVVTSSIFLFFYFLLFDTTKFKHLLFNNLQFFFYIGVIQAFIGILQYFQVIESNSSYCITGTFENTAGLVSVLALIFPIGINTYKSNNGKLKILAFWGNILISLCILLSSSRIGTICMLTCFAFGVKPFFKIKLNTKSISLILIIAFAITYSCFLFIQKTNSTAGRLAIWKITIGGIVHKPIMGHGKNSFSKEYMKYQAKYFKNNPKSKSAILASNVSHPLNEYLKVLFENGILGLLFYTLILFFIWKLSIKSTFNIKLLHCFLVSLLILCCASYPFKYPSTYFLTLFFIFIYTPNYQHSPLKKWFTPLFATLMLFVCVLTLFSMKAEMRWANVNNEFYNYDSSQILQEYQKVYYPLRKNPYFLYNFSAELYYSDFFRESLELLNLCENYLCDYDTQILNAQNFKKLGKLDLSVEHFKNASYMVPSKFYPYFNLFEIYTELGDMEQAKYYANLILNKEVKVPSQKINYYKLKAQDYLSNHK